MLSTFSKVITQYFFLQIVRRCFCFCFPRQVFKDIYSTWVSFSLCICLCWEERLSTSQIFPSSCQPQIFNYFVFLDFLYNCDLLQFSFCFIARNFTIFVIRELEKSSNVVDGRSSRCPIPQIDLDPVCVWIIFWSRFVGGYPFQDLMRKLPLKPNTSTPDIWNYMIKFGLLFDCIVRDKYLQQINLMLRSDYYNT